jgi:hypothetical protein
MKWLVLAVLGAMAIGACASSGTNVTTSPGTQLETTTLGPTTTSTSTTSTTMDWDAVCLDAVNRYLAAGASLAASKVVFEFRADQLEAYWTVAIVRSNSELATQFQGHADVLRDSAEELRQEPQELTERSQYALPLVKDVRTLHYGLCLT